MIRPPFEPLQQRGLKWCRELRALPLVLFVGKQLQIFNRPTTREIIVARQRIMEGSVGRFVVDVKRAAQKIIPCKTRRDRLLQVIPQSVDRVRHQLFPRSSAFTGPVVAERTTDHIRHADAERNLHVLTAAARLIYSLLCSRRL